MTKVGKWLSLVEEPHPLDTKCPLHPYKGWYWRTVLGKDPDWVLWVITESRYLLKRELEKALVKGIKGVDFSARMC